MYRNRIAQFAPDFGSNFPIPTHRSRYLSTTVKSLADGFGTDGYRGGGGGGGGGGGVGGAAVAAAGGAVSSEMGR